MVAAEKIKAAVEILAEAARPTKIILFGSYARGDASDDSDVDLLVIKADVDRRGKQMVALRDQLSPLRIPVDVLLASESELEDWGHLRSSTLYWALKEGTVVYEAAG